jgi:hypothetical protein
LIEPGDAGVRLDHQRRAHADGPGLDGQRHHVGHVGATQDAVGSYEVGHLGPCIEADDGDQRPGSIEAGAVGRQARGACRRLLGQGADRRTRDDEQRHPSKERKSHGQAGSDAMHAVLQRRIPQA